MNFRFSKYKKNKEKKEGDSRRKVAVIVSIAIIIAVVGACVAAAAVAAGNRIDVRIIDEDAGENMLVNVPENYSFSIEKKKPMDDVKAKDFVVYDIEGNPVKTSNSDADDTIKINAPQKGYEVGGIYTLDLQDKGSFQEEDYHKAKKITFLVAQKETREVTYRDGVLQPKDSDVKVSKDTISLKGKYNNGDIIIADTNKDDIDEIYQLKDVHMENGTTKAGYEDLDAENVYKKVNIFYSDYVDFRDAEIDEDALLGSLHEMGVLDAFTEEVYAADDSDIDVTVEKKGKNEFCFHVTLKDPKDKDKKLKITFSVKCQSLAKYDEKIAMVDNSLTFTSGMEFSVEGKDSEQVEKSIKKALQDYKNNESLESSQGQYEVPFVPIKIPLVGPICINLELGLTSDVMFSAEFNAGVDASLTFSQGIIYDVKKQEERKKYADITGDIEAHLMVSGELDAFAGIYGDASLDIPLLIKLGVDAKAGPYLESQGCFSVKGIPKDIKSKGYYKIEIGVSCKANWTIKVLVLDEKSNPIVEKKRPLAQYSKYLDLKDVSLKDQYYLTDAGVTLGTLTANYHNIIENKDQNAAIEKYQLFIDDNAITVENGVVQDDLTEGEHKVKLEWEYEGDKFNFEKNIKVIEYSPWDQFDKVSKYIGMSADRLCSKYNMSEDTECGYGWSGTFYESDLNLLLSFSSRVWYTEPYGCSGVRNVYDGEAVCTGVGGNASQLMGVDEKISVSDMEQLLDCKFRHFNPNQDDTIEAGDSIAKSYVGDFYRKGEHYSIVFQVDTKGIIVPGDLCEVWIYEPICLI